MNRILLKKTLNPTVTLMKVDAPLVARRAEPGQFIILRVDENGERIPLTIADFDRSEGSVTIIYQIVGATTEKLNHLQEGDYIHDFVGPLGRQTHTEGLKKVAVVGGGVGCAIAYPVAKKLHAQGCEVHAITGFRNKDLVILENEFEAASSRFIRMSDDGSWGEKGLVTDALRRLIESGEQLPSVRQLAMELSVNPNTIQKAYQILESSGIIYSVKGKGSFISDDAAADTAVIMSAKKDFKAAVKAAAELGLRKSELVDIVIEVCEKGETEK